LNTFLFAALVLPLQLGLALGMAMLVNQKIPGVTLYRTIYFSPVVTSMVVISIVWGFMYNKDVGLLNQMLDIVTFGKVGPFNWLGSSQSALVAIVLLSAWQGMGLQMIIFLAGLQGIPETLYEAASIDGANTWQKFRNVTLPSLRNTFVFIIIATTISAFALFTQINILTRGGPNDSTTTVMFHIVETGFRQQNIAGGTAMSVIYFVIILLLALFQRRVLSERAS
jgi:multiple sugar transport system permease protein